MATTKKTEKGDTPVRWVTGLAAVFLSVHAETAWTTLSDPDTVASSRHSRALLGSRGATELAAVADTDPQKTEGESKGAPDTQENKGAPGKQETEELPAPRAETSPAAVEPTGTPAGEIPGAKSEADIKELLPDANGDLRDIAQRFSAPVAEVQKLLKEKEPGLFGDKDKLEELEKMVSEQLKVKNAPDEEKTLERILDNTKIALERLRAKEEKIQTVGDTAEKIGRPREEKREEAKTENPKDDAPIADQKPPSLVDRAIEGLQTAWDWTKRALDSISGAAPPPKSGENPTAGGDTKSVVGGGDTGSKGLTNNGADTPAVAPPVADSGTGNGAVGSAPVAAPDAGAGSGAGGTGPPSVGSDSSTAARGVPVLNGDSPPSGHSTVPFGEGPPTVQSGAPTLAGSASVAGGTGSAPTSLPSGWTAVSLGSTPPFRGPASLPLKPAGHGSSGAGSVDSGDDTPIEGSVGEVISVFPKKIGSSTYANGGSESAALPPIPMSPPSSSGAIPAPTTPKFGGGGGFANAVVVSGSASSGGGSVLATSSSGSGSGGSVLTAAGASAPTWMLASATIPKPVDPARVNLLTTNDLGPAGVPVRSAAFGPTLPAGGTYGPLPWKNESPIVPPASKSAPAAVVTTSGSSNGTPWSEAGGDARRLERAAASASKPLVALAKDDFPPPVETTAGGRAAKAVPPKAIAGALGNEDAGEANKDGLRVTGVATAADPSAGLRLPTRGPKPRAAKAYKQPPVGKVAAAPPAAPVPLSFAGRNPVAAAVPAAPAPRGSDLSKFRQGNPKKP